MTGIGNMGGENITPTNGSTTMTADSAMMLRYHRVLHIY